MNRNAFPDLLKVKMFACIASLDPVLIYLQCSDVFNRKLCSFSEHPSADREQFTTLVQMIGSL